MHLDKKLSEHFTLGEFVESETADEHLIDNTVPPEYIPNVVRMARWLESVRGVELNAKPITITSGYRSVALNRTLDGSPTSAHLKGLAVDIVCPKFGTPLEVARALTLSLSPGMPYDQIIYEGDWVHIGLNEAGTPPRQEVLTKVPSGYVRGLP